MQAILYWRFSTMEQRDGASLDRQKERTEEMCGKHGWTVERVEIDQGKSAFKGEHRAAGAAFARIESEARAGILKGKVVVIEKLSRLSRLKAHASYDLMRTLVDNGVRLAVWEGDKIYESAEKIDLLATIELFLKYQLNNEESEGKRDFGRDKWKRRRQEAADSGKIATALGPFWLEIATDDKTKERFWNVIPERAALVVRVFEMADCGMGSMTIAKALNAEGHKPWGRFANRTPKDWEGKMIRRILSNPAVVGDKVNKVTNDDGDAITLDEAIPGYYPQIVDSDLYDRVRRGAEGRFVVKGGRQSSVVTNLVSGLAFCRHCGGPMEYKKGHQVGFQRKKNGVLQAPLPRQTGAMHCRSEARGSGCEKIGMAYLGFEDALLDSSLHLAMDEGAWVDSSALANVAGRIADKRREHDGLLKSAEALWTSYAEEPSAMVQTIARKKEAAANVVGAEIAVLEAERERLSGAASAAEHLSRLKTIRGLLSDPDIEIRRVNRLKVAQALASVIDRIWFDDEKRAHVFFKHGRTHLTIFSGMGRRPASYRQYDLDRYSKDDETIDPAMKRMVEDYRRRVAS